jgi:hypothetical protein
MKKLLISIGSLLILAFVVILFVNAEGSKKDPKKAKTEVVATPCPATCTSPAVEKTAACDPATCTAHKEGTQPKTAACDPATCTAHQADAQKTAQSCDPMASCAATCGSKAPVKK